MMTVQGEIIYKILYALLLFQSIVYFFLSLPLPRSVRLVILPWLRRSKIVEWYLYWVKYVLGTAFMLFISVLRSDYYLDDKRKVAEHKEYHDMIEELNLKTQLFLNQRNAYITSGTLAISWVLYRQIQQLNKITQLEEERDLLLEKSNSLVKDVNQLRGANVKTGVPPEEKSKGIIGKAQEVFANVQTSGSMGPIQPPKEDVMVIKEVREVSPSGTVTKKQEAVDRKDVKVSSGQGPLSKKQDNFTDVKTSGGVGPMQASIQQS